MIRSQLAGYSSGTASLFFREENETNSFVKFMRVEREPSSEAVFHELHISLSKPLALAIPHHLRIP